MNIAEILKDCPKGMELDCTMYENVEFDYIEQNSELVYPIHCLMKINGGYNALVFTRNGCNDMHPNAKCVIFPKGKTTWEGFVPPCQFKDGDILATDLGSVFFLKTRLNTDECYGCYVGIGGDGSFHICEPFAYKECCGLATEKEKEKLFQAIKDNGYKWNPETKTLEKLIGPYFHEGDWITCEELNTAKILSINMDRYEVEFIDGNKGFPHIDYIDRNFHLWTIQDAKDGDVLAAYECLVLFKKLDGLNIKCYCNYHFMGHQSFYVDTLQNRDAFHPATKEQRDLLFQKMKEAGYKWNPETKTLEKLIVPKFKVGNKIKHKDTVLTIINLQTNSYIVEDEPDHFGILMFSQQDKWELINEPKFKVGDRIRLKNGGSIIEVTSVNNDSSICVNGMSWTIKIKQQDNYELVPNKFDIATLKPFDKVLVRDFDNTPWEIEWFSRLLDGKHFKCFELSYVQCIPYEENKHLLGTSNDCDDFYKTWE